MSALLLKHVCLEKVVSNLPVEAIIWQLVSMNGVKLVHVARR